MNLVDKKNICIPDKNSILPENYLDIEGYISLIPFIDKFIFGEFINGSKEMTNDINKCINNKFNINKI